jgi:hypothetical protein
MCVRGDLQRKRDPAMEDQHSPAASMKISKLLMADVARHKAMICQLDVIGSLLQAIMIIRLSITLPRVNGEVFPKSKEYYGKPLLIVTSMY